MIDRIKSDMIQYYTTYEGCKAVLSCVNVLDCGAGDGTMILDQVGEFTDMSLEEKNWH